MADIRPCPFCGYGKPQIDRKRRRAGYTGLDDIIVQGYLFGALSQMPQQRRYGIGANSVKRLPCP